MRTRSNGDSDRRKQPHRHDVGCVGKSQDVRTDTSFVDVMVGDPTIADVNPLTDHTLSILGKKIGTTRVSVYAENKKLAAFSTSR